MAKSLKTFVRESAIKKEVATWTIQDCDDYLKKHNDDVEKGSIMAKKINIVMEHQEILKNIESAKKKKGDQRENLLKDVPFDLLIKNAPKEVRDPEDKKLRNYQKHTGVYLWSLGYDIDKFLGAGANAVTWSLKDSDKVLRVACDRTYLGFIHLRKSVSEYKNAEEMERILELKSNKPNHKNPKHILTFTTVLKDKKRGKSIFEAEKAKHGDLEIYSEKYDLKTAIQFLSDILKGIKKLHDKGYSHNDIKPANILISDKIKQKGDTRKAAYVADLGNVTQFDKSKKFAAPKLHAPDYNNTNKEAVKKRDVYSAGALTLFKLANIKNYKNYLSVTNYLVKNHSRKFYNNYLKKIYPNISEESEKDLLTFLDFLEKMVQPNYKKRIDLETAITKVKKLKNTL